jgi:16S rRNA processing protein RimM
MTHQSSAPVDPQASATTPHNVLPWLGDAQGCFKIGRLGKPHGVKGEIGFFYTDDIFDRTDADYLIVVVDGLPVPFFIDSYRFRSDELALVKFDGVDTEDEARELTGDDVYFPRSEAADDEGDLSWAELSGFTVTDAATGQTVGTVTGVDDATLNTLLEVRTADGRDLLLPLGDDLVEAFDRDSRSLSLHIPDGLLDL